MSHLSCSDIEDLLPAYALNALSPEDVSRVEEHLETCPWCPALLREHQTVAAALAHGAPLLEPASSLRQRVIERAVGTQRDLGPPRRRPPYFSTRIVGTVAASAAILLLAGVVAMEVTLFDRVGQLRNDNEALATQVGEMSQDAEQLVQESARLRLANEALSGQLTNLSSDSGQMLQLLSSQVGRGGPAATLVARPSSDEKDMGEVLRHQRALSYMIASQVSSALLLEGAAAVPQAHGVVIIAGGGDSGMLVTYGLKSLPPDKAYQLWLWKGDHPYSGGLFSVDETGWGSLMFSSAEPIAQYGWIGITDEPVDGSSEPSGSQMMRGRISSD